MKELLTLALAGAVLHRAVWVALVVGTILTLINQGDLLIAGLAPNWAKAGLTYLVPFCVSVHGAMGVMRMQDGTGKSP